MVDTRSCKKAVSSLLSVRFIILPLVANLLISKQLIEVSSICLDLKQTGLSTIDDICCIFFLLRCLFIQTSYCLCPRFHSDQA